MAEYGYHRLLLASNTPNRIPNPPLDGEKLAKEVLSLWENQGYTLEGLRKVLLSSELVSLTTTQTLAHFINPSQDKGLRNAPPREYTEVAARDKPRPAIHPQSHPALHMHASLHRDKRPISDIDVENHNSKSDLRDARAESAFPIMQQETERSAPPEEDGPNVNLSETTGSVSSDV